eukprot:9146746-Pyramimonas_sp.AAC.1
MYGYAANQVNHGVSPVAEKAASLLFRRMHPSLLGDDWRARNTMLTNQGVATGDELAEADVRCMKVAFQP